MCKSNKAEKPAKEDEKTRINTKTINLASLISHSHGNSFCWSACSPSLSLFQSARFDNVINRKNQMNREGKRKREKSIPVEANRKGTNLNRSSSLLLCNFSFGLYGCNYKYLFRQSLSQRIFFLLLFCCVVVFILPFVQLLVSLNLNITNQKSSKRNQRICFSRSFFRSPSHTRRLSHSIEFECLNISMPTAYYLLCFADSEKVSFRSFYCCSCCCWVWHVERAH